MAEPHPIPSGPRFQDLRGRVFGRLTVLFYAGKKSGKYSLWHCRCECGQEKTVISSLLTLGQTTQCLYCFRHAAKKKRRSDFEDLTGRVFGRLTVIRLERHTKTNKGSRTFWRCQCSCGEIHVVRGDPLKDGKTQSCGCLNVVRPWTEETPPETIQCWSCKEFKPMNLTNFYRSEKHKFGFKPFCRQCRRTKRKDHDREEYAAVRLEVLAHYSDGELKCQCPGCGETHLEFLTIDHIGGTGAAHRREIKNAPIYAWLKSRKFPPGYQVLCMNCNFSLGKRGYCPHCIDAT